MAPRLLLAAGLLFAVSCHRGSAIENVLLISIDTLRADRLGSYGYPANLTPNLDRLAAEGIRFDNAISHSPWTTPSHMTLMTSLHPSSHSVTQGWQELVRFRDRGGEYRVLPERVVTLAEELRQHGFRTLALTGGGTLDGAFGFDRGFDMYLDKARKLSPQTWSQLSKWLSDEEQRPFFLFFHTFEVHAPYTHVDDARPVLTPDEAETLERFIDQRPELTERELKDYLEEQGLLRVEVTSLLYDGGIRFTDWFLGRLFDEMKELGLWDTTLVVVTSDHGEEFADHRPSKFYNVHCDTLYDELIRVPLILRAPGRFTDGRVLHQQVRLLDVAPTILDVLGVPIPEQMEGTSLVGRIEGDERNTGNLEAFSEALCVGPEWKSVRYGGYKYIVGFEPGGERIGIPGEPAWEKLFDLGRDPKETVDLSDSESQILSNMRSRLFRFFLHEAVRPQGKPKTLTVEAELEERLRSLGYIE